MTGIVPTICRLNIGKVILSHFPDEDMEPEISSVVAKEHIAKEKKSEI